MFNHSPIPYSVGDTFIHRQQPTRVAACYPDPFGFLLKLENIAMELYSLESLNHLRQLLGKEPLKSWKESKSKLIDAIAKAKAQINPTPDSHRDQPDKSDDYPALSPRPRIRDTLTPRELAYMTKSPKKAAKSLEVCAEGENSAPKQHTTGDNASASTPRAIASGMFSLGDVARELGMQPKVARARMRRAADVPPQASKYVWADEHRPRIRQLLKGAQ